MMLGAFKFPGSATADDEAFVSVRHVAAATFLAFVILSHSQISTVINSDVKLGYDTELVQVLYFGLAIKITITILKQKSKLSLNVRFF